jgi:hypothetical protein
LNESASYYSYKRTDKSNIPGASGFENRAEVQRRDWEETDREGGGVRRKGKGKRVRS